MPKVNLNRQQASESTPLKATGSTSLERLPDSFTQGTLKDSFLAQAQLKTSLGLRKKTLPPGGNKPGPGSTEANLPSSASALAVASQLHQGQVTSGQASAGRTSKLSADYISGAINSHVYQSSRLSHVEQPTKTMTVMPPLTQRQPQRHSTKVLKEKKPSTIAEERTNEAHVVTRLSKKKTGTTAVTSTAAAVEFPNFYSAASSQRQAAVLGITQNLVDPPKLACSSRLARKGASKGRKVSPVRKVAAKRGTSALKEHDKAKRAPSS